MELILEEDHEVCQTILLNIEQKKFFYENLQLKQEQNLQHHVDFHLDSLIENDWNLINFYK